MPRFVRVLALGVIALVSTAAAAALWARSEREGTRLDDSVTFLGHDASTEEIARLLGLEIWRFRYRAPEGSTSLEVCLRLRRPGEPVLEYGGWSTGSEPGEEWSPPSEIVIGFSVEQLDGRRWLRIASLHGGAPSRSDPIEIPVPMEGGNSGGPQAIGEHEYAIRWSRPIENGQRIASRPDPAHDTIWSISIGPVPSERLPPELRPK